MKVLGVIILVLVSYASAQFPAGWTYDVSSTQGPNSWKNTWATCGVGNQSPIDIDTTKVVRNPVQEIIEWGYATTSPFIFNKTAIVAQFDKNSAVLVSTVTLTENGLKTQFVLDTVRIHSFSEHKIDSKTFPLEFEFIHTSKNTGNKLIISLLGRLGTHNAAFDAITTSTTPNWSSILPQDKSYFEYTGTLSTPPCTAARRIVLISSTQFSETQYNAVRSYYDVNWNAARPVTAFNGTVYYTNDTTPRSGSVAHAISFFNFDAEAWYGSPIQTGSVGWTSVGRDITISDNSTVPGDSFHYASASNAFRGNLSHLFAGVLSFDVKACTNSRTINYTEGDIIIKGFRTELVASFPYKPNNYFPTSYSFLLDVGVWRVRTANTKVWGTVATMADIKAVLSFVKCVDIRSRFSTTSHLTHFDNVILADGANEITWFGCAGTSGNFTSRYTQCSGHGLCLKGTCKCNYGWTGIDCSQKVRCANRRFGIDDTIIDWKAFDPSVVNPDWLV